MKTAILGSNGFVGRHLVNFLESRNIYAAQIRHRGGCLTQKNSSTSNLPISEYDAIVDCCNITSAETSEDIHIKEAKKLMECIDEYNFRGKYVLLSSISVYGHENKRISENTPANPINAYGTSKLNKENWARERYRNGLLSSFSILRATGILGAQMGPTFIRRLQLSAKEEIEMTVYDKSSQFNSIISVEKICQTICMSLGENMNNTSILASKNPITLGEVCNIIKDYYGSRSVIKERQNGRPPFIVTHQAMEPYLDMLENTEDCLKTYLQESEK